MYSRAAVLTGTRSIEVQEFQVPRSIPQGHALVRIEATGMCGSDYELYDGTLADSGLAELPLIMGHEPVGIVERISSEASVRWGVKAGERIAVEGFASCGSCQACGAGRSGFCSKRFMYGYASTASGSGLWGGFSEVLMLKPTSVVHRISSTTRPEIATFFNPMGAGFEWVFRDGGMRPGDRVLILGPGQRGMACAMAAEVGGASLVAVTGRSEDAAKLDLALNFGADVAIDIDRESVRTWTNENVDEGGFDLVIDTVPYAGSTVADAISCARPGGRIVLAGVKGRLVDEIDADSIVVKGLSVKGAFGVGYWSNQQAIGLIESGRFDFHALDSHRLGIENVEEGLRMLSGDGSDDPVTHVAIVPDGM